MFCNCKRCGGKAVFNRETGVVSCENGCLRVTAHPGRDPEEIWNRLQKGVHKNPSWYFPSTQTREDRQAQLDREKMDRERHRIIDEERDFYNGLYD